MDALRCWVRRPSDSRMGLVISPRMAGAGSSKTLRPLARTGWDWDGGVGPKLPYRASFPGESARPSLSLLAGPGRVDGGGGFGDRPMGAGLARRGSTSSGPSCDGLALCRRGESGHVTLKVAGETRGGMSPEMRRKGEPCARRRARDTALTYFLPAL